MYWEQFKEEAVKKGLQVKKETSKPVKKENATAREE